MKVNDFLFDKRSECYSVMTTMKLNEYLSKIRETYENKGGIEGQRSALKTKSATTIRNRMTNDIIQGTVLPPIVLGMVINNEKFKEFDKANQDIFGKFINSLSNDELSIIDGMQRTTSLFEAMQKDPKIADMEIRVEFWIAKETINLLYRMLILNTGQVPWNLRKQVETVYKPLIREVEENLPEITLLHVDGSQRRTRAGQYGANDIVELYLVFGSRNEKINTREQLADEFTRLDFIESSSGKSFNKHFFSILDNMVKLDNIFSKYEFDPNMVNDIDKFKSGKDLFTSQTVKVGYIAACSKFIMGFPGMDYDKEKIMVNFEELNTISASIINKITEYDNEQLGRYLDFGTLNQQVSKKSTKIGDFERTFFTSAFTLMIQLHSELDNLTPAWRVHG